MTFGAVPSRTGGPRRSLALSPRHPDLDRGAVCSAVAWLKIL